MAIQELNLGSDKASAEVTGEGQAVTRLSRGQKPTSWDHCRVIKRGGNEFSDDKKYRALPSLPLPGGVDRLTNDITKMQHNDRQEMYSPYANGFHYSNPSITTNVQETLLVDEKDIPSPRRNPHRAPSHHPFSLVVIALWTVFIVAEIVLLQRSVALAPTTPKLPWYYSNDGLPSVFFTIFTQGHAPVTSLHLSRLAISALQFRGTAPRTWLEVFWLADMKWAGPVGIIMWIWSMMKLPVRVSPTIAIFSVTVLSAFATPFVLSRAYPFQSMDVPVNRTFVPNTLAAAKLATIDAYAQIAVGAGSWSTNLTVLDIFNASTFIPSNASRVASTADLFFAGDVQSMDVTLPGVRIQGGCHAMDNTASVTQDGFLQLCHQQLPSIGDAAFLTLNPGEFILNVSYCTTEAFQGVGSPSNTSALIWFANNPSASLVGDLVEGIVQCETNFTTGTALLSGRNLTYDNFVENDKMYTVSQAGEALLDPLYAALYHFHGLEHATDDQKSQLYGMLGYTQSADSSGEQKYTSPSLDGFAAAMWRGATHMTTALAVLGRDSATAYTGTAYVAVSGRTRDTPFFVGALVLLGAWLFSMVGLTAFVWRPTVYGDTLDGYCAARLTASRPDLVSGGQPGGISENRQLLERFDPVVGDI
ncbi:hypothetical protein PHLGIDRAFT_119902 [Phlebiopsis gigantea 11061_1 CR5-6]|uniref:Uncharacterized protein n=1 Tax=Phlebiopsis gigantea (strain 11061_1 CR5-6) TaxID=745531 RepID=A0A0C3S541_PHLG1|nr:hypothetical protein PHLGIDRAFT_119902 [Phlebiopsis gigantea 11061_1 CR5-6]